MNINPSDVEMNKLLANNPSNLFYCCLSNQHNDSVKKQK